VKATCSRDQDIGPNPVLVVVEAASYRTILPEEKLGGATVDEIEESDDEDCWVTEAAGGKVTDVDEDEVDQTPEQRLSARSAAVDGDGGPSMTALAFQRTSCMRRQSVTESRTLGAQRRVAMPWGIPQGRGSASGIDHLGLPTANPPPALDLRRFIGPGDILTYRGGNQWGHTMLVLSTPKAHEFPILLDRPSSGEVLQHEVPVYAMKTLESASNFDNIRILTHLCVVHPVTKQVCACSVQDGDTGAVELWEGAGLFTHRPVDIEVLLSPLSGETLDMEVLRLSVDETRQATQDLKWSTKTAVRAFLRSAELDRSKYITREQKLQLASKIEGRWGERPVCSTVPPRVWQKYLLKSAHKHRTSINTRPFNIPKGRPAMKQSCSVIFSLEDDPDVAWAEDLLRLMPVRDDRVLPDELIRILTEATSEWKLLDFAAGPPQNRSRECGGPPASEYYEDNPNQPVSRQLFSQDVTSNGNIVALGEDEFTLYCGAAFAEPQKICLSTDGDKDESSGGRHYYDWDGRCGPHMGPQCLHCRRVEDRLAF